MSLPLGCTQIKSLEIAIVIRNMAQAQELSIDYATNSRVKCLRLGRPDGPPGRYKKICPVWYRGISSLSWMSICDLHFGKYRGSTWTGTING